MKKTICKQLQKQKRKRRIGMYILIKSMERVTKFCQDISYRYSCNWEPGISILGSKMFSFFPFNFHLFIYIHSFNSPIPYRTPVFPSFLDPCNLQSSCIIPVTFQCCCINLPIFQPMSDKIFFFLQTQNFLLAKGNFIWVKFLLQKRQQMDKCQY